MTFTLDTSGTVLPPANETLWGLWSRTADHNLRWSDLTPFTQGYIEALFSSQPLNKIGPKLGAFMGRAGFSDLAPETLARIIADCEAWIAEYVGQTAKRAPESAYMGGEFWRIRQTGRRSTFPPLTVQLGDDGKVRFAEACA